MVSTATLAMSFAVLWFGRSSIVWIVVGVILLDVGVQENPGAQSVGDLRSVTVGAEPGQLGVHDDVLRRRCRRLGGGGRSVRPWRLGFRVHPRRLDGGAGAVVGRTCDPGYGRPTGAEVTCAVGGVTRAARFP